VKLGADVERKRNEPTNQQTNQQTHPTIIPAGGGYNSRIDSTRSIAG